MPRLGNFATTLAGLSLLGLGCVGNVMETPGSGQPGPAGKPSGGNGQAGTPMGGGTVTPPTTQNPPTKPAEATPQGPGVPGPAVFRRMTKAEYNNTVRDLVGDTSAPANAFPSDSLAGQSGFTRGNNVSGVDGERIYEATQKLAADVVEKRLGTILPCGQAPAAEADQDKCASDFVLKFGSRAFRRPLMAEEQTAFLALYKDQRTTVKNDFASSIRVLVSAMLLSPNFLYRWETLPATIVKEKGFLKFNGYEIASRLSYGLWATMPDDELFDAAAGNKLGKVEELEAQVRRMLTNPKARDAFADFVVQWLDISDLKDQTKSNAYTNYNTNVAGSMLGEVKTYLGNLMFADGKLETLFTSKTGFVDEGLAKIYGVTGVTGAELKPAPLNPAQRGGILSLGAFLAGHAKADESGPIGRGVTVASRVLCKALPPPPDDVPPPKPPLDGVTTRERFADHATNPCAASCHNLIDPLGFAFENYDAVGQWRSMDSGKMVNAAATVMLDDKMVSFTNGIELQKLIASSKEASDCMGKQWMRYMLRRQEVQGDEASLKAAGEAFSKSGHDLRELIVALTKTQSFTHRTASAGELLP